MSRRRSAHILIGASAVAAFAIAFAPDSSASRQQNPPAPRILYNVPARAIEYQLGRLTNEELALVERKADDVRYRPVYFALLTRGGLAPQFRDEALTALVALDKATRTSVLLEAFSRVSADDNLAAEKLAALFLAQPVATLKSERAFFIKTIDSAAEPLVLRAAYDALMVVDGSPEHAWKIALAHEGHLTELLRGIPVLPTSGPAAAVRTQLFAPVASLLKESQEPAIRVAALAALGSTRRDAGTFTLLAQEIATGSDADARAAAVRSLQSIPEEAWPAAAIEPLARAIVARVRALPANERTRPDALDLVHAGERVSGKLPPAIGRGVRRDLRALNVRVIRVQTLPEKLQFDVRWFAAEAGKPVQIVLVNVDAMPHNLLITRPGALEAVGTAGGAMPMPTDPAVTRAFVPDTPLVLHATNLLKEGETARLGFTAPKEPGEYPFVCTFPGHWVRMYGVMLVVTDMDVWEAKPTVPTDPMTKQPFTSPRN